MDDKDLTSEEKDLIIREEMAWLNGQRARGGKSNASNKRMQRATPWVVLFHLGFFLLGLIMLLLFKDKVIGLLNLAR